MSIDLQLGDGIAGLADLDPGAVSSTITDPPFDERTHRAALEACDWRRGGRRVMGALPFAPLRAEELEIVAGHLARVTRRWIVVFAAEREVGDWVAALEAAGARFVRLGFAVRDNPRPQMSGDRPGPGGDPIVICHAAGARLRWNGSGHPGIWRAGAARFDEGGQVHPTQKPLRLMRQLVEAFSDPGELVLDPFAGSGTAAVACRLLGRAFLGWEINAAYHAAAQRRIAGAREQLGLGFEQGDDASEVDPPATDLGHDRRAPTRREAKGSRLP